MKWKFALEILGIVFVWIFADNLIWYKIPPWFIQGMYIGGIKYLSLVWLVSFIKRFYKWICNP